MTPVYSPQVLDHFEHPRNAGTLPSPDAVAQRENPVCGDVLKLTARVADGRIADIRFQAKGCVPAMACGSAVTELAKGRSLEKARLINKNDIIRALGEVPSASSHAADLAVEALHALLAQLAAGSPR